MKDLYIVGAGGFSTEIIHLIEIIQKESAKWRRIFLLDHTTEIHNTKLRGVEIVGDINVILEIDYEIDVVISINNVTARESIVNILSNNYNIKYPNIISPYSIIDFEYLKFGIGNVILHNVILSTNLMIGNFNIFNSYTGVGHDCKIGNFNSFGPRVAISGNVSIGNMNDFGVNSTVLQKKTIGDKNNIWMNSSIFKNIKNGNTYFGIPAKKIDL